MTARANASRAVCLAALVVAAVASAHPRGFHKHDQVVVKAQRVEVLVTLDVDGGTRAQLLRSGADANRDRAVDSVEAQQLKAKLIRLAVRPLKVTVGGYPVLMKVEDSKLSLRDDRRTGDTGLSVAILLGGELPRAVFGGMKLVVEDEAPDGSHVKVRAEQAGADGGVVTGEADLRPGERLTMTLQGAM